MAAHDSQPLGVTICHPCLCRPGKAAALPGLTGCPLVLRSAGEAKAVAWGLSQMGLRGLYSASALCSDPSGPLPPSGSERRMAGHLHPSSRVVMAPARLCFEVLFGQPRRGATPTPRRDSPVTNTIRRGRKSSSACRHDAMLSRRNCVSSKKRLRNIGLRGRVQGWIMNRRSIRPTSTTSLRRRTGITGSLRQRAAPDGVALCLYLHCR